MDFSRQIPVRLVRAELQQNEIDGQPVEWYEVDLLRLDEPGVIQSTIGKKALNGTPLKPGDEYLATVVPKAVIRDNRAFVIDSPKCQNLQPKPAK